MRLPLEFGSQLPSCNWCSQLLSLYVICYQGSLRSFIYGLRRSHITSPRDLIARYGGHPVTVPRTSDGRMDYVVDISRMAQSDAPSRPLPVLHRFVQKSGGFLRVQQHSLSSSLMAVIPNLSVTHNRSIMNTIMLLFLIPLKAAPYEEEGSNPRSAEHRAGIPAAYEKFTGRAYQ
ncbi:hypothetical protein BC826DRAFT_576944 [Russula brevipes]|nr:hypothetical protein BC826DRAFT_576944 [Russula brevipes]